MLLLGTAVPGGRLFALDQQTLISIAIQLLNICILAAALTYILYKPVQEFMARRTERISNELQTAEKRMAEADRLKAEYQKKLKEIDIERLKILEAAREEALNKSKHIIEEARAEALALRKRTEEMILAEKERLKMESKQYIIEVATLLAEKIVKEAIDSDIQDRLYEETIAELEEATWLN